VDVEVAGRVAVLVHHGDLELVDAGADLDPVDAGMRVRLRDRGAQRTGAAERGAGSVTDPRVARVGRARDDEGLAQGLGLGGIRLQRRCRGQCQRRNEAHKRKTAAVRVSTAAAVREYDESRPSGAAKASEPLWGESHVAIKRTDRDREPGSADSSAVHLYERFMSPRGASRRNDRVAYPKGVLEGE
jgi:hypothetical protein